MNLQSLNNKKPLKDMDRDELKKHIFQLQDFILQEQSNGKDIDAILDETTIFDEFETILPDNEFPIFVITILNDFKSDIIIDKILDIVQSSVNNEKN
tara:strand:- start:3032 stop:3322 length:291 start_codon:yes stop_codon:yes gene_type:complete